MDCAKGHVPIAHDEPACPLCAVLKEQKLCYEILADLFNGLQVLVYDIARRMNRPDETMH